MQPTPIQPFINRHPKNDIHIHPTRQLQKHLNRATKPFHYDILHKLGNRKHSPPIPILLHKFLCRFEMRPETQIYHLHLEIAVMVRHTCFEYSFDKLGVGDIGGDAGLEDVDKFVVRFGK
ncbi:MAG: hypothetical protein Q9221_007058 [Calogaya cf. arnoldii]